MRTKHIHLTFNLVNVLNIISIHNKPFNNQRQERTKNQVQNKIEAKEV